MSSASLSSNDGQHRIVRLIAGAKLKMVDQLAAAGERHDVAQLNPGVDVNLEAGGARQVAEAKILGRQPAVLGLVLEERVEERPQALVAQIMGVQVELGVRLDHPFDGVAADQHEATAAAIDLENVAGRVVLSWHL